MARYNYERLSAQDNAFLLWETPNLHMHVASTLILKAGPLRTSDGGIDVDRIKALTNSILHRVPRYRQRLAFIPQFNHAVWVDDEHFNLDYHIRHTALPKPGSEDQLKQLSARIMAQQLDRSRPLWENWIVEGLEDDRFAIVTKLHHCMIDGSSGMDLAQILFSMTPDQVIAEAPRFIPRPCPTPYELWRDETQRTLTLPFRALQSFRRFRSETEDIRTDITARLRAIANMTPELASGTPINGDVGPHRVFDWLTMNLEDVKTVKNALSATVNDTVLTVVTGAIRSFLIGRGVRPEDVTFIIQAPVSMRGEDEKGKLGNRVSGWTIKLPIGEDDPRKQLKAIHKTTQELKKTNQALGIETINTIAEWTTSSLLSLGARAATGTTNSIVTNVPGPQFPLYLLGAEQVGLFPQVPLLPNVGLGIALISYNGMICWGFNADYEMVPDLRSFVRHIEEAFERLAALAGVEAGHIEIKTPNGKPKRKAKAAAASLPPAH